ncbi:hypothetical protein HDV01_001017 [Terramyces sp. JEL0728]|nr:hypothetical protein HDV01_001017 [Terramyces sp. JEL0728]
MELFSLLHKMESKYQPMKPYFYNYVNNRIKKHSDYDRDINALQQILNQYTKVEFCDSNAGQLGFLCCGVLFNASIEKIEVFQEAVNSLYPPQDFFSKLSSIQELEIVSTNFSRDQKLQFCNFLNSKKCGNLRILRLSEFDFSLISKLPLDTLEIHSPRNLCFSPDIKYLRKLQLSNVELAAVADSLKAALESTTTITELVFRNINFGSCTCRKFTTGLLKNTSLTELEFSKCQFKVFRSISNAIAHHSSIEHLRLNSLGYPILTNLKYILENKIIHTLTFSKSDDLLPYKELIEESQYLTHVNHHLEFPNLKRNRTRKQLLLIDLLTASRALIVLQLPYELQKLVFNELCLICMVPSKYASSLAKYMLALQPLKEQEGFSLEALLNKCKEL